MFRQNVDRYNRTQVLRVGPDGAQAVPVSLLTFCCPGSVSTTMLSQCTRCRSVSPSSLLLLLLLLVFFVCLTRSVSRREVHLIVPAGHFHTLSLLVFLAGSFQDAAQHADAQEDHSTKHGCHDARCCLGNRRCEGSKWRSVFFERQWIRVRMMTLKVTASWDTSLTVTIWSLRLMARKA